MNAILFKLLFPPSRPSIFPSLHDRTTIPHLKKLVVEKEKKKIGIKLEED